MWTAFDLTGAEFPQPIASQSSETKEGAELHSYTALNAI